MSSSMTGAAARRISDFLRGWPAVGRLRLALVLGLHHGLDAAPRREVTLYDHAARAAGSHQGIENLVRHCLVEDPAAAETLHVVFQCFQLEAQIGGDVRNPDFAEVRLARNRTHRRELGALDGNLELPFRSR